MTIRRSIRCRLRIEALEGREVPATLTATTATLPDPATTGADVAVVSDSGPTDLGSVQDVTDTGSLDGTPETQQADLAVFATVDKIKPSLGDTVTLHFTILNNGDLPASGVKLTAILPAGLAPISSQTSDGTYDSTSGVWDAGIIFPGAPLTMTLTAHVTDTAEQPVSASITAADQTDPVADNNSANLIVTPVLAGVSISQVASQSVATINGTVTFTVTVKNTGPGMARNLVINETLPAGLNWVRLTALNYGSFDVKSATWKIGSLAAGASAKLQFVTQVTKTGKLEVTSALTATGIDETRSTLQAAASTVGTKTNSPATWSYTAPGYQPMSVMPAAIKPVATPSLLAQLAAFFKLLKMGT